MLKLALSCHKHPHYRPAQGTRAIKGGCDLCQALVAIIRKIEKLKRDGQSGLWRAGGESLTIPLALTYKTVTKPPVDPLRAPPAQPSLFEPAADFDSKPTKRQKTAQG